MSASNRKNVAILSLTLGVVMLGFGMVMPVMPFYIESMGASATELGLLVAISPFIQLVASPLWGGVSVDTLARGTPDEVRHQALYTMKHCAPGGGLILASSHSVIVRTPLANYRALVDAIRDGRSRERKIAIKEIQSRIS